MGSARCTNGHEIPPRGPGQHTNGRTVCRPCEDAGARYRVVWMRKVTTSPGPCVSPVGGADASEHRYVPSHIGGAAVCIGCGKVEEAPRAQ